jgi:6,7-dimethyl-8-ribityllumazine synthase
VCGNSALFLVISNPRFLYWNLRGATASDKNVKLKVYRGKMNSGGGRFGIVVSRWNDFLTSKLLDGALDAFQGHGIGDQNIEIFKVPGAFELPLTAQKLAETGRFDAIVTIGVVIRGETPHFDYVAGEAAKGIAQVGLKTGIPVIFGVVTTNTLEQAINRSGVKAGNKGYEAAVSAIEMSDLFGQIEELSETADKGKAVPHVV